MKQLYLAVWHDRHTDDKYVVFTKRKAAVQQCYAWKATYPQDRYTFVEEEYGNTWRLYCADDYQMWVEKIEYRE